MRKKLDILGISLLAGAVLISGPLGCRKRSTADDYEWITMDESYTPRNYIEEFIKNDSEAKGIFPVSLRNYGRDTSILRRFRGSQFAKPNEAALNMAYPALEDWMLVDIKYENERKQEVLRTILYIQVDGGWRVGDSGRLLE
ncbi:MAG: hypothetical protein OEW18_02285 [Candidatus Aminicenantes bacterium]|nr:hypothetical protein [Candidatus Aminicenantes bacterium]